MVRSEVAEQIWYGESKKKKFTYDIFIALLWEGPIWIPFLRVLQGLKSRQKQNLLLWLVVFEYFSQSKHYRAL